MISFGLSSSRAMTRIRITSGDAMMRFSFGVKGDRGQLLPAKVSLASELLKTQA
jgi:hypothetical protein